MLKSRTFSVSRTDALDEDIELVRHYLAKQLGDCTTTEAVKAGLHFLAESIRNEQSPGDPPRMVFPGVVKFEDFTELISELDRVITDLQERVSALEGGSDS